MTGSPPTVAENGIDFFSELTKAGRDHIRHKDLDKALSLDISRVSWNISSKEAKLACVSHLGATDFGRENGYSERQRSEGLYMSLVRPLDTLEDPRLIRRTGLSNCEQSVWSSLASRCRGNLKGCQFNHWNGSEAQSKTSTDSVCPMPHNGGKLSSHATGIEGNHCSCRNTSPPSSKETIRTSVEELLKAIVHDHCYCEVDSSFGSNLNGEDTCESGSYAVVVSSSIKETNEDFRSAFLLKGFHLDLDSDPDSGDEIVFPVSSLVVSISASCLNHDQWQVTSTGEAKIKFSKVLTTDSEEQQQAPTACDQTRLRNGRVLNKDMVAPQHSLLRGKGRPLRTTRKRKVPLTPELVDEEEELSESPKAKTSPNTERRKRRGGSWRMRFSGSGGFSDAQNDSATSGEPEHFNKKPKKFNDFEPVILQTRSRTETATLLRRRVMEKDIEMNELERLLTALDAEPDEEEALCGSSSAFDSCSSSVSSFCRDGSSVSTATTPSILLDEFTPDLVARCKKLTATRYSGDTVLHKVCRSGKYEMVRYLIAVEGALVNSQDNAGWTPLHEAVNGAHVDIARLLLLNGADVNVCASDGTRPLHDAIEVGSLEVVQLLIEHGADPLAELGEKTPLEYALMHNQLEIYDYLQYVVNRRLEEKKPQAPSHTGGQSQRREKPSAPSSKSPAGSPALPGGSPCMLLPVEEDGCSSFGAELEYPLFYICPPIEVSQSPLLPVYNFPVCVGDKIRKHNFHWFEDVLQALQQDKVTFLSRFPTIRTVTLSSADVREHLKCSWTPAVWSEQSDLEFVPLCSELRTLLDIEMLNLDD